MYCCSCGLWITGLEGFVDCPVLAQKFRSTAALSKCDLSVVEDTGLQKLIHRTHHMQHHHIMARFADRHVKLRIEPCLFVGRPF